MLPSVASLPSVRFEDRHLLPAIPAVYIVRAPKRTLYVGSSNNLRQRFHLHSHARIFKAWPTPLAIAWYCLDEPRGPVCWEEFQMIQRHKPLLNINDVPGRKRKDPARLQAIADIFHVPVGVLSPRRRKKEPPMPDPTRPAACPAPLLVCEACGACLATCRCALAHPVFRAVAVCGRCTATDGLPVPDAEEDDAHV